MLSKEEAQVIYAREAEALMRGARSERHPIAYILGGQGACGKSALVNHAEEDCPFTTFLKINGDEYRRYHPRYRTVQKEALTYSEETQPLSSVFTESLIRDGSMRHLNLIIEGTMRDAGTVLCTAALLNERGYEVRAAAIAAPAEYTRIGIFDRYLRDITFTGHGRLADVASHDKAAESLPGTLEALQHSGIFSRIDIYDLYAKHRLLRLEAGETCDIRKVVEDERRRALSDKVMRSSFVQRAIHCLDMVGEPELRRRLEDAAGALTQRSFQDRNYDIAVATKIGQQTHRR